MKPTAEELRLAEEHTDELLLASDSPIPRDPDFGISIDDMERWTRAHLRASGDWDLAEGEHLSSDPLFHLRVLATDSPTRED